jgi:hypothetical protein
MGMFDSYVNEDESLEVQLKNGECLMNAYRVGDTCDLSDAFYYGNEGVVVVRGGKVASVTEVPPENDGLPCFTKWGDRFEPHGAETLADHNPIARGVAARQARLAKSRR